MSQKNLNITDILDHNVHNYKILNKGHYLTDRVIHGNKIIRNTLQLLNIKNHPIYQKHFLLGWGQEEYLYFSNLPEKVVEEQIHQSITNQTPAVILSKDFKPGPALDILIKISELHQVPIYQFNQDMTSIFILFHDLISNKLMKKDFIHASLVIVNSVGVLIKGDSGIGKSESVLELIQEGHIFVSDDSTEVYKKNGSNIYGRSPKITKDLIEIRGIGLINIPFIYGQQSIADTVKIDLVVELLEGDEKKVSFDRLGIKNLTEKILDQDIPKILIPIKAARTISSLIIAAVSVYVARKKGTDPLQTIKLRSQ